MAASRIFALLRSSGLAKLVPPLSFFEYVVCPQSMDVWTSPSPSSCEIRPPYLHKYRSTPAVTRGVKLLPSSLCPSGCSLTFDPHDASGDLLTECLHVLGNAEHISDEFMRSLGHGFGFGIIESMEMSAAFAKFVRFVAKTFDLDHFELFIHHWLLMCSSSGGTDEVSGSNGPSNQEPNPSDEGKNPADQSDQKGSGSQESNPNEAGQNPGDGSDPKGSEDKGESKDKKDHRIECDCARFINGSSCERKCCHDLKFELQKQLYDVSKVKEVLHNLKVTSETKSDLLDEKIFQVREEMKDLEILKQLVKLLHADIEARKLSVENKESSHQEQKDKHPDEKEQKDKHHEEKEQKDKHHEEKEQKDKHHEEKEQKDKWKKWKMALRARRILALVWLKREFPKTPRDAIASYSQYQVYLNVAYFIAACYIVVEQEDLSELLKQQMIIALYNHDMKKAARLKYYNEQKQLANEWWAEKQRLKKLADGNSGET